MNISLQIEAVYRRALLLRQYATECPVQPDLLDKALEELYFVLEELQTSQEELHHQNQELIATQQAVERERQRYWTLFELAPNGYLVTDLQGKIYQANNAAACLFSIPQEYLIDKPLVVLIDESDRPLFPTRLANFKQIDDWEVSLNSRNGKKTCVSIVVTRIKDSQTRENMLLWSLHDTTLRQQMEQQLQSAHDELEKRVEERTKNLLQTTVQLQQEMDERQQAEQKIREQAALIDIATDAIFVQDLDHHILFWNQGAERLYGWKAIEIIGKKADERFDKERSPQLAADFNRTLEQGSWQDEFEQLTQSGKTIIVASRWTLVRDESGQPHSILVVNTDITEKKQREEKFYRDRRLESLGTLASGISHDLNNIFTPILITAQVHLRTRDRLDREMYESWETIEKSIQIGIDLVRQILMFARGTENKRIPLQIEPWLIEVLKTVQRTFPKSIEIYTDIPTQTLGLVCVNPTQLQQIVMNLCLNARDAMPAGGILTLSAENRYIDATYIQTQPDAHVGNYVAIFVADTGTGILPSLIERIFEEFFTTKKRGEGTGLGLSTVLSITQNHGGFVEVSSEIGKGTRFGVYLPAMEEMGTSSPAA